MVTVKELVTKIQTRQVSVWDTVTATFKLIQDRDTTLHSFLMLTPEYVRDQVERIERKIQSHEPLGPLAGVPVAVKDNICIRGIRTTCGSKILASYIAPYDATVVERLIQADAIIVGKTNMDEFAMGSSTETSYFGVTRNPHHTDYIPGGSSGGSAVAVAAGMVPLSLGSDTGGSIRQPAACCGIVGLKPTYGRVSRYGLVAFASSLDQIGPLAQNVYDCAMLLQSIAGYDKHDSTSVNIPVPEYTTDLDRYTGSLKGVKLGLPREYFVEGIDPEVENSVRQAVNVLSSLGAEVKEVSLPHTEYALAVYYIIAPSEASANLARYDGIRFGYRSEQVEDLLSVYERTRGEGFGPEVKRRIMLGTYALSAGYYDAYYGKAQRVRTLIKQDFDTAFKQVDIIVTPTTPTPAFKLGEKTNDPLQMYLSDIYTISCNLAGIPGISIPCGKSKAGLPVGLQLLGKPFDEHTIFTVAYAYEQAIKQEI